MKTTIAALLIFTAVNLFAADGVQPKFNSGPPLLNYPQPPAFPKTTNAQLTAMAAAVNSAQCPKCKLSRPLIRSYDSKKGYSFECAGCGHTWKPMRTTIAGPPALPPAPPKTKGSVFPRLLTERHESVGFVKKVPFPVLPKRTPRLIPAAAGSAVPVEVAFHGPPYVVEFPFPYSIKFLYSDYYLEGGRTYQFEEKNDVTGAWMPTQPPYTPQGDEVYAKAPAAFEVNGAYSRFGTAQMRVVAP